MKKLIVILAALSLALMLFSGCGRINDSSGASEDEKAGHEICSPEPEEISLGLRLLASLYTVDYKLASNSHGIYEIFSGPDGVGILHYDLKNMTVSQLPIEYKYDAAMMAAEDHLYLFTTEDDGRKAVVRFDINTSACEVSYLPVGIILPLDSGFLIDNESNLYFIGHKYSADSGRLESSAIYKLCSESMQIDEVVQCEAGANFYRIHGGFDDTVLLSLSYKVSQDDAGYPIYENKLIGYDIALNQMTEYSVPQIEHQPSYVFDGSRLLYYINSDGLQLRAYDFKISSDELVMNLDESGLVPSGCQIKLLPYIIDGNIMMYAYNTHTSYPMMLLNTETHIVTEALSSSGWHSEIPIYYGETLDYFIVPNGYIYYNHPSEKGESSLWMKRIISVISKENYYNGNSIFEFFDYCSIYPAELVEKMDYATAP